MELKLAMAQAMTDNSGDSNCTNMELKLNPTLSTEFIFGYSNCTNMELKPITRKIDQGGRTPILIAPIWN